jgi:beta-phosphoglucomutase family hydrolase
MTPVPPAESSAPPAAGLDVPPHIRGLIFDFDGTLADTMPLHWQAWRQVAARNGFRFTRERLHQLAGIPSRDILRMLSREQGLRFDIEAVARPKEEAYLALLEKVGPIEPLVNLARSQRGRRRLAVASGGSRRIISRVLDHLGIRDWFDAVVTQEDVARQKPAPDIFLEAARRLGLPPAQCRAYEDADLGLAAIRAAGMEAVDVRPWLAAADPPAASRS